MSSRRPPPKTAQLHLMAETITNLNPLTPLPIFRLFRPAGTVDALANCTALTDLNLRLCRGLTGEITPQLVAWLSGIKKKNLTDCGKFTLASDMSAIRDITSIDLSNMNTLEGKKC